MTFYKTLQNFKFQKWIWSLFLALVLSFSCSSKVFAQEDENQTNEAIKIFNSGQDAHEKGKLQEAVNFYNEAIKLAPEFPEAEYQKASALLTLGDVSGAEKSFRRALELREDWTLPMANLGSILVTANKFSEAETLLEKAIKLDENNFPAYVALTDLRLKTNAQPNVLRELLIKLENITGKANPTAALWASRSALERILGNRSSAKASLKRALAIEPKNKSALLESVEIAISEGDYAIASENVKLLAQSSTDANTVKLLQARIFASSGKPNEALKVLNSIENPNPEVIQLRERIQTNSSVNFAELEKQLEKEPKNSALLGRLCTILRVENALKAIDYCRRAVESEPDNINHAIGFGAALVQAKQFEPAVNVFKKLVEIAPDNATARANLATALFQLKRYPEAKSQYLWLTEKQPNLPFAYYFLAIVHDNLGEYLDAMANYQQFLKLADATANKLEIEKVNLRLPSLQKQIKETKGKK